MEGLAVYAKTPTADGSEWYLAKGNNSLPDLVPTQTGGVSTGKDTNNSEDSKQEDTKPQEAASQEKPTETDIALAVSDETGKSLNELYDGQLSTEEIIDFVEKATEHARKELESVKAKIRKAQSKVKPHFPVSDYKREMAEAAAPFADELARAEYNLAVAEKVAESVMMLENAVPRSIDEVYEERELTADEMKPSTADEVAAYYLMQRGKTREQQVRIDPESFRKELALGKRKMESATGHQSTEERKLLRYMAGRDKGGQTIEYIAERLASDELFQGSDVNFSFNGDVQKARDAIISVLMSEDIENYLLNSRREQVRRDANAVANAIANDILQRSGLTADASYDEQRLAVLQNAIRESAELVGFDDIDFLVILANKLGISYERKGNNAGAQQARTNDHTPEEGVSSGGSGVLQTKQPTERAGRADSKGAAETAGTGTGIQDGGAQAEVGSDKENTSDRKEIAGLPGYTEQEVIDIVRNYISEIFQYEDPSVFKFVDAKVIGSRVNGDFADDSDLDILVEYSGSIREDDAFSALNSLDGSLDIDGIRVDINPIKAEKSGTIDEWLESHKDYVKSRDKVAEPKQAQALNLQDFQTAKEGIADIPEKIRETGLREFETSREIAPGSARIVFDNGTDGRIFSCAVQYEKDGILITEAVTFDTKTGHPQTLGKSIRQGFMIPKGWKIYEGEGSQTLPEGAKVYGVAYTGESLDSKLGHTIVADLVCSVPVNNNGETHSETYRVILMEDKEGNPVKAGEQRDDNKKKPPHLLSQTL